MANTAQITVHSPDSRRSTGARTAAVCNLPLTTSEAQVANAPRRHAIRHNISPGATFTLLPGEDAAAFEQLVADYPDEFKPRTAHELFLVNQMIQAQWRISRIERLQAEVLDVILNVPVADGKSDEAAIVASMGFAHGQTFDRLERYGRAAERAYFRANKELKQYRAQKQNEAKHPVLISETSRRGNDLREGLPECVGVAACQSTLEQNEAKPVVLTLDASRHIDAQLLPRVPQSTRPLAAPLSARAEQQSSGW